MFRPGFGAGGYGRRRQRGGMDLYMMMLLTQLLNQIYQLERKPPVTLAIMGACAAAFFDGLLPKEFSRLVPSVSQACLQPYMILQNRQWSRLILSAFLHADEYHLYWNASSLLWKGVQLEFRYGPAAFAALVAELLLLSHALVVGATAALAYYVPEYSYLYLTNCSIGISALLFAMKVVLTHDQPGWSNVFGFSLPTKYMAWGELVLASVFNPRASFLGHLAGIAAGLIHVRLAPIGLRWLRWAQVQARVRFNPGQAHFAAAGGAGPAAAAAAAAQPPPAAAGTRAAPRQPAPAPRQPPVEAAARAAAAGGANAGSARLARSDGAPAPAPAQQQQQQQHVDEVLAATSRHELSAEELRQRRLQRFGAA